MRSLSQTSRPLIKSWADYYYTYWSKQLAHKGEDIGDITPGSILSLATLQQQKCYLSDQQLLIPSKDVLSEGWNPWLKSLPHDMAIHTPCLVKKDYEFPWGINNIAILSNRFINYRNIASNLISFRLLCIAITKTNLKQISPELILSMSKDKHATI